MHVAGVAIVPNAPNSHLRFLHVFRLHTGRIKHRLRSTLAFGLSNALAVFVELCHGGEVFGKRVASGKLLIFKPPDCTRRARVGGGRRRAGLICLSAVIL